MTQYLFETDDFALSEEGIHLLRNKFNFKTITYEEISKASIAREVEIKRPFIIFCLGAAMFVFAFKQTNLLLDWLSNHPRGERIHAESILLPVFPGLLGAYCLFIALKKGPMFTIEEGSAKHKLRLSSFFNNRKSNELISYLNAKLHGRLHVKTMLT